MICLADNPDVSAVDAAAAASADGDRVNGGDGEHAVDGRPLHGRVHSGRK